LDRLFCPRSVVVVGASEREGHLGAVVMDNLVSHGFEGEIYPVNGKHKKLWERRCYGTVMDLPDGVDLAVIATPIQVVPEIIAQCVAGGLAGAVVLSAGGKESGAEGHAIEREIQQQIAGSPFRIIGPNCIGVIKTATHLNASFAGQMPSAGHLAFLSQSGAICTAILDYALKEGIGFSHFVSLGSMLDVDFGDMIDFLGNDPKVRSILLYIESVPQMRAFISAARAVSRIKPIIAFKAGRSRSGALAAASHTGAMVGSDAVYDAAFERAGIVRVNSFEALFDSAECCAKLSRPTGNGLAIVTNAGGPGVMAADALEDWGVAPVTLAPETIAALDAILPSHWSRGNPVDMIGTASIDTYCQVISTLLKAKEINGVLILCAPQGVTDPVALADALVAIIQGQSLPVITAWLGGAVMDPAREIFNHAGIPTLETPERAVGAFMHLYQHTRKLELASEVPARVSQRLEVDHSRAAEMITTALAHDADAMLEESSSKALLAAYGIPVALTEPASTAEEAVAVAERLGFPVVLKVAATGVSHKSDLGGVKLNLPSAGAVARAFDEIVAAVARRVPDANIQGVSVQPMIPRAGAAGDPIELILGVQRDAQAGPIMLFGTGGTLTEIYRDRALALPPLNRLLARRLMERTKIYRVLQGYRHFPAVDLVCLEEILVRLSQLVCDFAEIAELDINPLVAVADEICAVDARIRLTRAVLPAPLHLAISPYPRHMESELNLPEVGPLRVRPIRPEDAELLQQLFLSLSPRSIYLRFFSPLKQLSADMLVRFTQIDYDRQVALVAIQESGTDERMLGVARIIQCAEPWRGEFAVMVAEDWQGKGIGAYLLQRCLDMARQQGIRQVFGAVLAENTHMLSLGRKLGFSVTPAPEAGEYEMTYEWVG
jgi:acetyltransferase